MTRRQNQKNSGNPKQDRNSEGRFTSDTGFPTGSVVAAATVAAAAAAGAFLWSRRAQIGEQAGKLGSRVSEQYDRLSDRFSEDTEGETAVTGIDPASSAKSRRMRSAQKSQREISEEALSLKQAGDDQTEANAAQSKVGAIAY